MERQAQFSFQVKDDCCFKKIWGLKGLEVVLRNNDSPFIYDKVKKNVG